MTSISQNLDDIVDCLCEKTKDYFSKKRVIKNTDSSYGILTEKSSSGAIFTNITIDGSKNQGNDDCGGAVSNINVEVSTILISKLVHCSRSLTGVICVPRLPRFLG